jgi:hypothetical protein
MESMEQTVLMVQLVLKALQVQMESMEQTVLMVQLVLKAQPVRMV